MSAQTTPTLVELFRRMEAQLEREPETVQGEIAGGVYLMSPRPRARHGASQGNLFAELRARFGTSGGGGAPPDWLFVIEPEIRSERTFSRLVPDVAAWRRSTSGWPDLDTTPITSIPEWVAEVLSPTTETSDRGEKADAYGAMGVGWLWLVDADQRTIETFANVRGRMAPGPVFRTGQAISGDPFGPTAIPVDALFA
jgi:Uma2 family endonuclease